MCEPKNASAGGGAAVLTGVAFVGASIALGVVVHVMRAAAWAIPYAVTTAVLAGAVYGAWKLRARLAGYTGRGQPAASRQGRSHGMCETRQIARECGCACLRVRMRSATETAQSFLWVVGFIVVAASARLILHVAVIGLSAILAALIAVWSARTVYRRRMRARVVIPAPLPDAPPLTVVEAVTVRAIDSPQPVTWPDMAGAPVRSRADRR
jgi:hypothetical protein